MTWSPQQEAALKAVRAWLADKARPQVFYLAGFAGTGKTTLAKELAGNLKGDVLFGAFTGKAALVLRRKGCTDASTIHSMIYTVLEQDGVKRFRLNPDAAVADAALVIIDECSMVGEALARDLLSFGTPVLVLGDPAQLPPVKDEGFFTNRRPDVMLTEIHRQAAENPIIRLSMDVREGRGLAHGDFGAVRVIGRDAVDRAEVMAADQILVGLNRTRHLYNMRIRKLQGRVTAMPEVGERVVCLRNDKDRGLLNGGLWHVTKLMPSDERRWAMVVRSADFDDGPAVRIGVHPLFFLGRSADVPEVIRKKCDWFDFGYALTVHKSQGSQWDNVYLFDESGTFRDDAAKWLYTGITRAAERLTVVL